MDTTKLLSDLQMLCGCIYEISEKKQVYMVGSRLEDIIKEHFTEPKIERLSSEE